MAGKSEKTEANTVTREEMQKVVGDAAASAAKAAVEALMPAVAAAVKGGNTPIQHAGPAVRKPIVRCHICRQDVRGCENKHVKMAVYPTRYPQFAKWFQGARINGVTYLSNNANHLIDVPAAAEGDIRSMTTTWEENESQIRTGRKKNHNSGGLGEGATGARSASAGWR